MELINCYEGFQEVYNKDSSKNELQEIWFNFMERHECVRRLCIDDYTNQGLDWKQISSDRLFNYDKAFVDKMTYTSITLEGVILSIKGKLNDFFKLEKDDTIIIIYHGLGNAAGWVTTYMGKPAIYLGVEKIVELGWNNRKKLEDLVSHEYGHLVHLEVREDSLDPYDDFKKKMIFRMYTEGVATYCEGIINGRQVSSPKWYADAHSKEQLLKKEFLKRLNVESKDCKDFFGDWNPVLGITEAGYYLGLNVIIILLEKMSILTVMLLDYNSIEKVLMTYLLNNN